MFLEQIKNIDPSKIVYSDETGIDDNEVTDSGWAPSGERCYATKSANRETRYNILAALNGTLLFAPFVFEGYSTQAVYETYVAQVLAPSLKPGMVVIIDNASFHKSKRIIELIEAAQCTLIFLPPYSPDFNPIEHYWTPIKKAIRTAVASSTDFYTALIDTIANLCSA